MKRIPRRPSLRYGLMELPLFRWAAMRDIPPFTNGGKWVHRRTGLPSTIANVIADLAGVGREPRL
jgi:hypothetical protein